MEQNNSGHEVIKNDNRTDLKNNYFVIALGKSLTKLRGNHFNFKVMPLC